MKKKTNVQRPNQQLKQKLNKAKRIDKEGKAGREADRQASRDKAANSHSELARKNLVAADRETGNPDNPLDGYQGNIDTTPNPVGPSSPPKPPKSTKRPSGVTEIDPNE